MITILRSKYNNGDNDGNITIKTKDKDIKCHSFVLENTSEYFRGNIRKIDFNGIIEMGSTTYDLINIVINYLYSEKIVDRELTCNDIVQLYGLLNCLKCDNSVMILRNHYLKKFKQLLNEENWISLLKSVFNIDIYNDLQEEIIVFYRDYILENTANCNLQTIKALFKELNGEIKDILYDICFEKLVDCNNVLRNSLNIEQEEKILANNYLKNIKDKEDSDEDSLKLPKKLTKKKVNKSKNISE